MFAQEVRDAMRLKPNKVVIGEVENANDRSMAGTLMDLGIEVEILPAPKKS
jgi:hypothetical protein